jgi:NarL family two-component system response regulator LiaR
MTDNRQPTDGLSPREREVLVLIASGKSSRQIAEHLGIAFKTVGVHRHNLHAKLKVHKAVDLTRVAIRMGLIDP